MIRQCDQIKLKNNILKIQYEFIRSVNDITMNTGYDQWEVEAGNGTNNTIALSKLFMISQDTNGTDE